MKFPQPEPMPHVVKPGHLRLAVVVIGLVAIALGMLKWTETAAPESVSHDQEPVLNEMTVALPKPLEGSTPVTVSDETARLGQLNDFTVEHPWVSARTERSPLADRLNHPDGTAEEDLRIVGTLLDHFRDSFNANPVGGNTDIVRVLSGNNPQGLAFLPPDHTAIDEHGRLLDRWGTPFFFHAESRYRMSVRSAGPDGELFTTDDIAMATTPQ